MSYQQLWSTDILLPISLVTSRINTSNCSHTKYESEKWVSHSSHVRLCDPMNCRLPGSSVHGIFQARVLEWVAISFSRGSFWPRDWTQVSHTAGRCFTIWATRDYVMLINLHQISILRMWSRKQWKSQYHFKANSNSNLPSDTMLCSGLVALKFLAFSKIN